MAAAVSPYLVTPDLVFPGPAPPRLVPPHRSPTASIARPGAQRRHAPGVYRRRRLAVVLAFAAVVLAIGLVVHILAAPNLATPNLATPNLRGPSLTAPSLGVQSVRMHRSGASGPAMALSPSRSVVAHVWVVRPGDTLWSIASASGATGDIRPLVDRLSAEVRDQPLQVGEQIWLP